MHQRARTDNKQDRFAESPILAEISGILSQAGIAHYIDPKIKRFGTNRPYLGIFATRSARLFIHYYDDGYIQAVVPKLMPPETIKEIFAIEGEDKQGENYNSRLYYVLDIPVENDKLNGKWTIQEKRDFFVEMAQRR
jgi:hypothetical protein